MCLIGLLLPFVYKKEEQKHSHRHSHRHRHRHTHSHRHRHTYSSSSSHRRSEHPRRDEPRRSEKRDGDEKDPALLDEDALARLCISLEQGLLEEQRRWRDQELLDRQERQRLGLETPPRERPPSEEAPPYSYRDESLAAGAAVRQQVTLEPEPERVSKRESRRRSTGGPDSSECGRRHRYPESASSYCCGRCVCARCGSSGTRHPTLPELDGGRRT